MIMTHMHTHTHTHSTGGSASGEGLQAAYQQTEGVALSVDGTGNKEERNEVVNLPGEWQEWCMVH